MAENPGYASRAMGLWQHTVKGPYTGYWRPNTGRALLDRHVCTVIGRHGAGDAIDPRALRVLEPLPHDIVRLDVPAGRWTAMSVWNTASGGHIRSRGGGRQRYRPALGRHPQSRCGGLLPAPTHDRYHEHLQEFFGGTIIALFTDEPQIMGRYPWRPTDASRIRRG